MNAPATRNHDDPERYWQARLGAHFDVRGAGYEMLGERFNQALYAARLRALQRALTATGASLSGLRVLEFGCGSGMYTEFCRARAVAAYTGIDLTQVSVDRLAQRYPAFSFLKADVSSEQFDPPQPPYDLVLIADVLFHILEASGFSRAIDHAARALRPGGRLIISDILPLQPSRAAAHVELRTQAQYEAVFRVCNLRVLHVEPIFVVLHPPPLTAASTWPWRLYARIWRHALLRVARRPVFDRVAPRFLAHVDRYLLSAADHRTPNTKWLVASRD